MKAKEQPTNLPPPKVQKKYLPLRSEADLIDAHEKVANELLSGEIATDRAIAIARVLKGSQFLIAELPYKKLTLLAKLRAKNVEVPKKLLNGFIGE